MSIELDVTTPLPRVAVMTTGGTIDSVGTDRLDLAWYFETRTRLASGELIAGLPELGAIAAIEEIPLRPIPSHGLGVSEWLEMVASITQVFADGRADGLVIAHGTNTIEETAYFLNLTLKTDRPVVLVGAMRPASALSADGPLNLLNAVRVAAHPCSVGRGVLVVLDDTIHGARDVTKSATYRVGAFKARDLGPLGYADADGRVVYYHQSTRRHTPATEFEVGPGTEVPRVDVVLSYVGADATMIDAAVAAGARGIVSAGTGAGRPTPAEDDALDRAHARGIAICQASRVGSGRVVRAPSIRARGFIAADNLPPWKARILLALALTRTSDPAEIQRMFDEY